MKNKVWSLSLIIISLLSNNIYAADKTVQAIPSNTNIYITGEDENKKADGLALYSIWGYNYIKLRDIGYLMNYNIIWDDESKEIHVSKGNETIESQNIFSKACKCGYEGSHSTCIAREIQDNGATCISMYNFS